MERVAKQWKAAMELAKVGKSATTVAAKMALVQSLALLGYAYRQSVLKMLLTVYGLNGNYTLADDFVTIFFMKKQPPNCMINIVVKLRGKPPSAEKIKQILLQALAFETSIQVPASDAVYKPFQKLRCRPETKFLVDFWVECQDFNIDDHVFVGKLRPGGSVDEKVMEYVHENSTKAMCSQRPPWKVVLLTPFFKSSTNVEDYALIISIDHAYGDGLSIMQFLRFGLCDKPFDFHIDPTDARMETVESRWKNATMPKIVSNAAQGMRNAVLQDVHSLNCNQDNIEEQTYFSFGNPISLEKIKKLRDCHPEISVSGVFCASLTKALRRIYREAGIDPPNPFPAGVVYAVLPYKSVEVVNNAVWTFIPLQMANSSDQQVMQSTSKLLKQFTQDPLKLAVTKRMMEFNRNLLSPTFTAAEMLMDPGMAISNVIGPNNKITMFDGDQVLEMRAFVSSIARNCPGLVALLSYNGQLLPTSCIPTDTERRVNGMKNLGMYFSEAANEILTTQLPDVDKREHVFNQHSAPLPLPAMPNVLSMRIRQFSTLAYRQYPHQQRRGSIVPSSVIKFGSNPLTFTLYRSLSHVRKLL